VSVISCWLQELKTLPCFPGVAKYPLSDGKPREMWQWQQHAWHGHVGGGSAVRMEEEGGRVQLFLPIF